MAVLHTILSLFGGTKSSYAEIDPPGPDNGRPTPTPEAAKPADPDQALARFIGSLPESASGKVVAGTMRLVEVKDVQSVGNGLWTGIADKVRVIAEDELADVFANGGFHQRLEDGGFVFCFANDDVSEAQAATSRMSERIQTRMAKEVPESIGRVALEPFIAPIETDSLLSSDMPPLHTLLASLEQIKVQQASQVRFSRASVLRASRVLFQPAWSRFRGGSHLNRCLLDGAYQLFASDWRHATEPSAAILCRMDAMLLTKAVERLHATIGGAWRDAILLVPVRYETLQHAETRNEYRLVFERIPEAYMRLIYVEILLGEVKEPPLDLRQTLISAGAFLPKIVLQWPGAEIGLVEGMKNCAEGLSLDLRHLNDQKVVLERRVPQLVEAASRAGLLTCATGANSMGLAEAARQAGFDFIVGTAIHNNQDEPRTAESLAIFKDGFA